MEPPPARDALDAFICGRGAQENALAELKGEFVLDLVPTDHYGANSAWPASASPRPHNPATQSLDEQIAHTPAA